MIEDRLRELRIKAGLKQQDLLKSFKLSQGRYSQNSYILASLEKPYIPRLLVLPIPLILLIIRLFEIFWGHTGVTTSSALIVLHLFRSHA